MKVIFQKMYNSAGADVSTILSAVPGVATNIRQKSIIENALIQYAFDHVYPSEGLLIYIDYHIDTPSVLAIRNPETLKQTSGNIDILI